MIKVNIDAAAGFNAEELQKIKAAQNVLNNILNTDKFKNSVLTFTTDGLFKFHYRRSFWGTWIDKPYSNMEVYQKLTQASKISAGTKQIDLKLGLLPGREIKELGYTNSTGQLICTYRTWLNSLPVAEYVNHLVHEWCHQLGFDHDERPNERNEFTVPFAIGKITENIAWEC